MNAIPRKGKRRTTAGIMALEPRIMFDGAAAHAAIDAKALASIPVVPAAVEVQAAAPAKDSGKTEAVFVDTSTSNWQALVAGLEKTRPGVEIDLIEGGQSGLAQIATWAETHSGYDAIHILSQGSEATLKIGSDTVTDASLSSATTRAELAEIGTALKAGGELALYGSSIGAGADGQQFLADLAADTGAIVSASSHAVGDSAEGGAWALDITSAPASVSALNIPGYLGLLGIGDTATANSPAPVEVQVADAALDGGKLEVAFIDTSVSGWETLVTGLQASRPGMGIELIDGTESGLAQMVAWADGHSGYDAIHVLSNGAEGSLQLGRDTLNDTSLNNTEVQIDLHRIAESLNSHGEILLYGSNIALGSDGQQFISDLAVASGGADIAASSGLTGSGHWTLDTVTGTVAVTALKLSGYDKTLVETAASAPIQPAGMGKAPTEVVVVDSTVADWRTLVAGMDPSIPVIVLVPDASGNGELAELAAALSQYHDLSAIHLVTEGRSGGIILGNEALWSGDLQYVGADITAIRGALKPGGDLLLYGCSVAGNDAGKQFINSLAADIGDGVVVAASTDKTGPTRLGGDWDLEYATGAVDVVLPFTLQGMQDFGHCLGCTVHNTAGDTRFASFYYGGLYYDGYAITDKNNNTVGTYVKLGGIIGTIDSFAGVYSSISPSGRSHTNVSAGLTLNFYNATGRYADHLYLTGPADLNSFLATLTNVCGSSGPTVSSINRTGGSTLVNGTSEQFTVTFSAAVTGVVASDFTATTTGTVADTGLTVSGSGTTWTVTVNGITGAGSLGLNLSTVGSIVDGSSNALTATHNGDQTYTIDDTTASNSVVPAVTDTTSSGRFTVGDTFHASSGTWTQNAAAQTLAYSYQWYWSATNSGSGTAISGATSANYVASSAYAHDYLRVVVTEGDGTQPTATANSAWQLVANSAPANSVVPTISGTDTVGNTLTATHGTFTDADSDSLTYSYQWYRSTGNGGAVSAGTLISGATGSTYALTTADAHDYVGVVVTASDGTTTTTASSTWTTVADTAPVVANAQSNQTASAGAAFSYQIPANTFSDADSDSLSYTVQQVTDASGSTLASGGALPSWLTFTSGTRTLSGTPAGSDAGTTYYKVTASDGHGGSVTNVFDIVTSNLPTVSSIATMGSSPTMGTAGLDYTVTFNQAVDNVVDSDFTVTKGAGVTGTPTITITAGTTGSTSYTVHVAGLAGDGTVELDLSTYAGIVSHANNSNALAAAFSGTANVYTLDNTAPSITGVTVTAGTYKIGDSVPVSITVASDAVTYTLGGGTVDGYSLVLDSKTATTVSAHFVVTSGGGEVALGGTTAVAGLVLTDSVGNSNTAWANASLATSGVTVDSNAPSAITIGGASSSLYTGVIAGTTVGALADTDASTIGDTTAYTLAVGNGTNDADNGKFTISGGNLVVGGTALTAGQTYHVFLKVQDENGSGNSYTQAFTIIGASGPTVTVGSPSVTWTETVGGGGTAKTLDSGLTVANGADGSTVMTGATVSISGNYTAGDTLAVTTSGNITVVSNAGGVLTLTGNDSAANYQAVLDTVTFTSSSIEPAANAANRTISWQVHDEYANSAAQTTSVAVHAVDNPPTLSATTVTTSISTPQATTVLFSGANANAIESADSITGVTIAITGLQDGPSEQMLIGGTYVNLTGGASGTAGSIGYSLSAISGGIATLTLTKTDTAANWNTILNGLAYRDNAAAASETAGARSFTVTGIRDSGSTTYGGSNSTTVSLASMVTLSANDTPSISGSAISSSDLSQKAISGVSVTDASGGATYTATVSSSAAGGKINVTGATITSGANDSASVTFTGSKAQINTVLSTLKYTPSAYSAETLTILVSDGGAALIGGAKAATQTITYTATAPVTPPPVVQLPPTKAVDSTPTVSSTPVVIPTDTTAPVITISNLNGNGATNSPGASGSQSSLSPVVTTTALSNFSAVTPVLSSGALGAFQVSVVDSGRSNGGDLVVSKPIGTVETGAIVKFTVPSDAFAVSRADAQISLSATTADGSPLPPWLKFNAATGTFEGQPPPGEKTVEVKVTARDTAGHSASQVVKIDFGAKPAAGQRQGFNGRTGLSAQLAAARTGHAGQLAMLAKALGKVA